MSGGDDQRDGDGRPPRPVGVVRPQQERHGDAADRADVGHRQVDLADQQHEHDADGDRGDRRHLQEQVGEVALGEEGVVEHAEHDGDDDQPDDDRQRARARRRGRPATSGARSRRASRAAASSSAGVAGGSGSSGVTTGVGVRRATRWCGSIVMARPLPASAMPGTWSIVPAVMACTTSCCVVSARFSTATRWPRRRTVIRSATSKTSWRLCETMHHAQVAVGQAAHEVEHLAGLGHAERGRRLVEDEQLRVPHHRLGDGDGLPLAARTGRPPSGAPTRAWSPTGSRASPGRRAPCSTRRARSPDASAHGRGTCWP